METKPVSLTYRISGIDLIEKLLYRTNVKEGDQYNFEVKSQSILTKEPKSLVIVFTIVNITKIGDTNIIAKFLVGVGFEILNSEEVFKENEEARLPLEAENLFKSISISTIR